MKALSGNTVFFRLAEPSNAQFIYELRTDANYNAHLSKTHGTADDQANWIERYKIREREGQEYYFIIARRDTGEDIGTVRTYDFRENPKSFCWGSWILNHRKTRFAAVESAMLVYEFAFGQLGFSQSHFDVRKENAGVVKFHLRFGARIVGENKDDYFFNINRQEYEIFRRNNLDYLGGIDDQIS